jgi:hypothetical protein
LYFRSYDNEGEDVEIDDVLGPEVDDDDNMSETSVRSTEQPIVIDKSLLHSSPRQVSGMYIDDVLNECWFLVLFIEETG